MKYLKFDNTQLTELEYSLSKEYICSNKKGAFTSSTIINCNTRKYHGMLICPLSQIDGEKHLLLSAVDETVLCDDKKFHLASRKYPNSLHSGYKFLENFELNPIPTFIFRIDNVILKKEILLASDDEHVMIKYTLEDAYNTTKIRLHPFIANRNVHHVQKANEYASTDVENIKNGIKTKMYDEYPYLFMQTSVKSDFQHSPDWFFNVVHEEEIYRGYESEEDLLVPGYFEFSLKKGESIVFSASLKEQATASLKRKFNAELQKSEICKNMEDCLKNSINQLVVNNKNGSYLLAGLPWFCSEIRDTLIALPGLYISNNDKKTVLQILKTVAKSLKNGLIKTKRTEDIFTDNEADTPLWFIWAIQQYAALTNTHKTLWKDFGSKISSILDLYKKGTDYNISMHDNGLIYAKHESLALTWMKAYTQMGAVTPRGGYAVEINALWYNAVCFAIELAEKAEDSKFVKKWSKYSSLIKKSFVETFWSNEHNYLADYVDGDYKNFDIRPNQIIAASLPYSTLSNKQIKLVLSVTDEELLTARGLRTLSPDNQRYIGTYEGSHDQRELSYHQGTVWPWLLAHYAEAYLKVKKKSGVKAIQKLYKGFEDEMLNAGIGSISEIYDGNEPHYAKGAVSSAKSIAELIRMKYIAENQDYKS